MEMVRDICTEAPSAVSARLTADRCRHPSHDTIPLAARIVGAAVSNPTPATLRHYAADWAHFALWCQGEGRTALPASGATFAGYLLAVAPGLSRGTLGRRRAAIGAEHRKAGLPMALLDLPAWAALRSSARPKDTPGPGAATTPELHRLAKRCPRDLAGLRDRALLLLAAALTRPRRPTRGDPGHAGGDAVTGQGVPRLFLLALDAEDVRLTPSGMTLQVRTRTDETGPTRTVRLTRALAADACPVRAIEDWLRASDTAFGPIFRKVDRWGNVEHGRLHPDAWNRILAGRRAFLAPHTTDRQKR